MLALHLLLDIYYYIISLYSVQCLVKRQNSPEMENKMCLQQFALPLPGMYRGELRACSAVQGGACAGSAVCRGEGSVPALLQPPRGSYTALQNLALSPRGAPLCCRGPQRGVAPASRLLGGATSYWTGPTTGLTTSYWSSP